MTAKRRLVPEGEVKGMVELMQSLGLRFGAVEVRADGVVFHPANESPGDDYDNWQRKNARRD